MACASNPPVRVCARVHPLTRVARARRADAQGDWLDDERAGYGREVRENGDVYEGQVIACFITLIACQ